jgi:tetratricopeptide (TPR) repeat protein
MVSPTNNEEARIAYNTGTALMRQNNFTEAENYFLRAIEIDNGFVDAMDHLGIVCRNLGKYEEAEKWYLRSIEINPNNRTPYINLAIVYRFQGRYEDARQSYLKLQRIDPSDPESYFGIGVLYQLVGQYRISIDFIKIAIGIYSEKESVLLLCNAMYIQGNNYYGIEEYEEALKYYKIALMGYPNNNEILNKISELKNKLSR